MHYTQIGQLLKRVEVFVTVQGDLPPQPPDACLTASLNQLLTARRWS